MREIIFWGATGQSKVINEAIQNTDMKLVALVDKRPMEKTLLGVPVLLGEDGFDQWLKSHKNKDLHFAVAIGGGRGQDRMDVFSLLKKKGLNPFTVVHKTAFVAGNVQVGEGCQILAQTMIATDTILGQSVIVNNSASIDHDCVIGDGAHIGPGACLAGEITVGAHAFIGTGAVILPRIKIGTGAVVGAGAVVTKDVPAGTTVVGNPARPFTKR